MGLSHFLPASGAKIPPNPFKSLSLRYGSWIPSGFWF